MKPLIYNRIPIYSMSYLEFETDVALNCVHSKPGYWSIGFDNMKKSCLIQIATDISYMYGIPLQPRILDTNRNLDFGNPDKAGIQTRSPTYALYVSVCNRAIKPKNKRMFHISLTWHVW